MSNYVKNIKNEFNGYNSKKLTQDLIAGITVAAVALPLSIAFAVSCGASAASGIISSIISGLIIGVLAGASFQISGPTGAMTTVLFGMFAQFGPQGIFITGLLAGLILLVSAFLKVGRLISFIPPPVTTGFTSGVAVIIALGQVNNFFGVHSEGTNALRKIFSYFILGFNPDWSAVGFGLIAMAVMIFWPKKLNAKFPAALAAIIITLLVNLILKQDIALVGQVPATLLPTERLNLTAIPFDRINEFILPAFTIAALCMVESLLCGASGGKLKGEKLDADQELFAQACGNIILPFFGAIPAASALSRTSVALKSVGTTRMTSVFHSIALIFAMLFLGPVISNIPLSALAGILMVTAWRMNDFSSIRYIFKRKFRSSILQYLFTFTATICFDLTIAIFIGVIVSILIFMVNISEMVITVSDVDRKKLVNSGITLKDTSQKIRIVYLVGPVFFGNMEKLEEAISSLGVNDVVIFSMRGVPFMDAGSAQVFLHLVEYLMGNDVVPMFSSLQPKVKQMLDRSGVTEVVGGEHFFWDAGSAIAFCDDI